MGQQRPPNAGLNVANLIMLPSEPSFYEARSTSHGKKLNGRFLDVPTSFLRSDRKENESAMTMILVSDILFVELRWLKCY